MILETMLWELLLLAIAIWLVKRKWCLRRQLALAAKLKTSLNCYPVIGHSLMFVGTDEDRMRTFEAFGREAIKCGGITPILQPDQVFICIADPVSAEVLMNQCLNKHEMVKDIVSFLIGNGSLFAPVSIWRPRRKILIPNFNSKNLNMFSNIFAKQSAIMADLMQKEVGKEAFSFWDYISDYNLDASCETTMGVKAQIQGDPSHSIKTAIDEMCQIAAWRICQPWLRSDVIFKLLPSYRLGLKHRNTLWDFINKIIKEKKDEAERNNSAGLHNSTKNQPSSFLDSQLDAPEDQRFTDMELLEEIIVLVLASSDTSATAAGYTALMLSRHPDVQEKVHQELQEVFGDSKVPTTAKDLTRLKYLEAVIKESLRLYPPVPMLVRRVDNDVTLPSGVTIVRDCGILLNVWAMHRNPVHWGPDADQFRPERFLNDTPKHPAAFVAFSYGLRNCIGYQYAMMSMKTVLSTMLRRYRVLTPEGVNIDDPVITKYDLMLRHVDNFRIRLENRK